jgi:hypothetical protein
LVLLAKYYLDEQIKEDKMAKHVARMGTREMHIQFWWRNLRNESSWKTQLGL